MEEQIPSTNKPNNPLLSRVKLPGETFTLPSGGLFYQGDELHPSVKNAEVHVHPMTALDEICIKTPDLLFSGEAVRQVFARCIPQVTNVDMLLAKDVDFLLTCLRKVSYGDELQIEHKHNCENAKNHTYVANVNNFIRAAKRLDATTFNKKFDVTLPNGQVVHMQPIRFKEFISVMHMMDPEQEASPEKIRDMMVESVSNIIKSVDEISDKDMIKEWLSTVPPQYIHLINDNIDKTLEWGPEFKSKIVCLDCKATTDVDIPMNPMYFFT